MEDLIDVQSVFKEFSNDAKAIILDVRTENEYNSGYIKGSVLLPLNKLDREIENILPDKNTLIYTICRSGSRSSMAKNILKSHNYKNVKNIVGGILQWQEEKLPFDYKYE
ncbi:MAG: rhodanese-like domain-containing protein [Patescibacteria group bacterium]